MNRSLIEGGDGMDIPGQCRGKYKFRVSLSSRLTPTLSPFTHRLKVDSK